MDDNLPYYDWNTGKSLQPWAWLWDDEDEEEWEFKYGREYDEDIYMTDAEYSESRKKSIRLPYAQKTQRSVDKVVDNMCKKRKIIINKNK